MDQSRLVLINKYFAHLDQKIQTLTEISNVSEEESLTLACCYIEALGVRQYQEVEFTNPPRKAIPYFSKAVAFTEVLENYSGYEFWDKINPIGLLDFMPKIFNNNFQDYMIALTEIGGEVRETQVVLNRVKDIHDNNKQSEWFERNTHKRKSSEYCLFKSSV
ncbi:MAG: hypothetical protein JKY67_18090 [Pseudomonadales bacterium]|nr:hypothetical protein [Pseudomonadales bacterium]